MVKRQEWILIKMAMWGRRTGSIMTYFWGVDMSFRFKREEWGRERAIHN
jgi:hypothetical protein